METKKRKQQKEDGADEGEKGKFTEHAKRRHKDDSSAKKRNHMKDSDRTTINRKTALLVIDVQNDFCTGSMKVKGALEIIPLINSVRHLFDLVAFSKDWHPPDHCSFKADVKGQVIRKGDNTEFWPIHCVQGTEGAALQKDLVVSSDDLLITKGENPLTESYSAFWDTLKQKTKLENELHNAEITDVFVCGLATDYCVSHTALDSVTAGFQTYFLPDLSRGTEKELVEARCKYMKQQGIQFLSLSQLKDLLGSRYEKDPPSNGHDCM